MLLFIEKESALDEIEEAVVENNENNKIVESISNDFSRENDGLEIGDYRRPGKNT